VYYVSSTAAREGSPGGHDPHPVTQYTHARDNTDSIS